MRRKLRVTVTLLLMLTLTISNMGCITHLFADEKESMTTDYKLEKPTNLQVADRSDTCIKLKWNEVEGADGYRIYRSTMKNGIYRNIDDVCNKTTWYRDKDLECGTNYYYKIRAFKKIDDKICLGCPSEILDTTTCPAQVKYLHTGCVSSSVIELSWPTVYKSSGYEVYRATSESGNYVRIATLIDNDKSCYRDINLKSGRKYYYKVRAFKESNGQICFGKYSTVLGVCTEK